MQFRGVDHPKFRRLSATTYLFHTGDPQYQTAVHVGHIFAIIKFNEQLRLTGVLEYHHSIPLGFVEFAEAWNTGVRADDPRRICQIIKTEENKKIIQIPDTTVSLGDFYITLDQIGQSSNNYLGVCGSQREVVEQLAAMTADQRRGFEEQIKSRGLEEQLEMRMQAFIEGPSMSPTRTGNRPRFHPAVKRANASNAGPAPHWQSVQSALVNTTSCPTTQPASAPVPAEEDLSQRSLDELPANSSMETE
jgi:hypothetical protein